MPRRCESEGLLAGVAVELSPRPPSRAGSWVAKEPYLLLLLFGLGFLVFLVFSLAWAGFFPWIFFVSCGLGGWVGLLSLGSLLLFLLLLLLLDLVSLTEGVSADDMVENSDRGRPSRLSCKPPKNWNAAPIPQLSQPPIPTRVPYAYSGGLHDILEGPPGRVFGNVDSASSPCQQGKRKK